MLEYPPSLRSANAKRGEGHVGLGWDTVEEFRNGSYRFSKNGGKPGVQAWLEHLANGIDWALLFNTGRAERKGPGSNAGRKKAHVPGFRADSRPRVGQAASLPSFSIATSRPGELAARPTISPSPPRLRLL